MSAVNPTGNGMPMAAPPVRRRASAWNGRLLVAAYRIALSVGVALLAACAIEDVADVPWNAARDRLWEKVQAECVQPATPRHSDCAIVDKREGYVLYKDMIGKSHYLVIPATPVKGVEDPRAWRADAPNYWAFGWAARGYVSRAVGKPMPPDELGLAINARQARSQDQLHIHVDCLSEEARRFVDGNRAALSDRWTDLTFRGKTVRARFIAGDSATLDINPFRLLAEGLTPEAMAAMPDRGIFVTYSNRPNTTPGFVIVDEPRDGHGTTGHASDFLDRACGLARASRVGGG